MKLIGSARGAGNDGYGILCQVIDVNLVNLSQENSFRLSLNFLHQTSLGVNTATTERVPTTKKPFIYRLNVPYTVVARKKHKT